MGETGKWVRKATQAEVSMDMLDKRAYLLVVYKLSFCSRRPVQRKEVEEALHHLYRKSPNLRVHLQKRDEETWFKEMDEERIDFEVSEVDVDEVIEFLFTHSHPQDGPLWRARLVTPATPSYQPQRLSSFHEDLQDTFPHCYHLVFGFSHTIGDGHTFIRVCAAFAHILDNVMAGEEVDENQIGCFDLNEEYDNKLQGWLERYFKDESLREQSISEMTKGKLESPLVSHLLSPSKDGTRKTVLYTQTLDEAATTRLVQRCRGAGITLSTCMAAVGNLALVDMLADKGVVQDTYTVSNIHLVNMRRTWPKDTTERAFGCYISGSFPYRLPTPRIVEVDKFWQYAKEVHTKFYDILRDDNFMGKNMLVLWCYISNNKQYLQPDLTYNTRGDLTKRFQGTKEITVTNLLSATSIHNTDDVPWDDVIGTMRGRLSHSTKYNSGIVSEATALQYSDLVFARLLQVTAL